MYNLENAPIELIRCLELGLPMPSGLLQRFPLVVLEQWRQQWMDGPGHQITTKRRAIEQERQHTENKRLNQLCQEKMTSWIEPGSIVTINAPRTSIDKRKAILITIDSGYSSQSAKILIDGNEIRLSALKIEKTSPLQSLDKDCYEKNFKNYR